METNKTRSDEQCKSSFGNGEKKEKKDWFNNLCSEAINKIILLRKKVLQNASQENISIFEEQRRQTNKILRRENGYMKRER